MAELEAERKIWEKHREVLKDAYRRQREDRKKLRMLLNECKCGEWQLHRLGLRHDLFVP